MYVSLRSLAAALGVTVLSAPAAHAQATLNLDVDFEFPALVLLRCVDDITLQLDSDTLLAAAGLTGTVDAATGGTLTESSPGIFTETGASLPPTSFSSLPIVLNSICGVRAIGAGATVDVDLTLNETTLTEPGSGAELVVAALGGRDGGGDTAGAGTTGFADSTVDGADGDFEVDVAGGFAQVAYVDVRFDLDLTDASAAGVYSSAGDLFTIVINAN